MNVLSLFDGISCGQLALIRAGFKDFVYYASEIDKNSINVTQYNFPNTIQLGSVTDVDVSKLKDIGLLIGGSPCVNLSFAGKGKGMVTKENEEIFELKRYLELKSKGCEFEGSSYLFWEYIRILKDIRKYNPDVKFLLENVSMKKKHEEIITNTLGVEPIVINSSLVSAQNRVRLYWTNIPNIEQPEDKGIKLSDIIEFDNDKNPAAIRGRKLFKATIVGRKINSEGKREDYNSNIPTIQCLEVRNSNMDKSNCLTTVDKDNVLTSLNPGRYPDAFKNKLPFRYYTLKECCRLQTVPDNYFGDIVSESKGKKMLGNGWTVDVISHILKNIENEK